MKKSIVLLLACFLFAGAVKAANTFYYAGSINSNKYHYQHCNAVKHINQMNLIFFSTPEEAISKGYVPCRICKPPSNGNGGN